MTTDNTDNTDSDEPSKAELHDRVQQLESTVEKLMPSRRDALKLGAAGIAGAAGLSATTQTADASTGSAGTIGSSSDRPDAFLDEANVNQLTGVSAGGDRQGCRVFLSATQTISSNIRTKIQFDSEVYDSDNNFDTASHAWTCPKDGLYMANLQVSFRNGTNDQDRSVLIGTATNPIPSDKGAAMVQGDADAGNRLSVSTINKYSSGDTIAGYAKNDNASDDLESGNQNNFTLLEVAFLGGL
jgi:hypothetical protein